MLHEWGADGFARRLLAAPRVVVAFDAAWRPASAPFRRAFEEADAEHEIPFVVADLTDLDDPRWDEHGIETVPTVAYFDHGEELDRLAAVPDRDLDERDLHAFLDRVESLEEDDATWRRRLTAGRPWRASW